MGFLKHKRQKNKKSLQANFSGDSFFARVKKTNTMKKALLVFAFLFLPILVTAQEFNTEEACEQAGGGQGFCRSTGLLQDDDNCQSNQDTLGICSGYVNNSACCKFKDNGPVDPDNHGIDLQTSSTVPVIGVGKCTASKSAGGWGGVCKNFTSGDDACEDGVGHGEEDFVGFCEPPGMVERASHCCVAKGTAIKNPTADNYLSIAMSESTCESPFKADGSGYSGSCEDVDSTIISELLDGKEPSCDNTGQIAIGICRSSVGGDSDNVCCVPKDGDYCKKLKEDNGGSDVCSGGIGGTVAPLQYGDYTLLEQIPGSSNTSGKLQPYLESIYKAGFVLIVLGAIFMIGFGGFIYMSSAGNTYMIKKGKGLITDAIVGLVVALIIWLILSIINPDLVNLKIDPLPGVSFDPAGEGEIIAGENSIEEGGGGSGYFEAKTYSGSALFTDAQARSYLSEKQIQVNKQDCESASQTSCTSLGEFPRSMANIAAAIKSGCNCEVVITGGTEAGHATHGKGKAAMDMRKNPALDRFFSKFTKVSQSGGKPIYQYASVRVWFEDGEHYHIWEPAK